MPTLLNNINIPGIFSGLSLEYDLSISSNEDLIKDIITTKVLIPYINISSVKRYNQFDTSYLIAASEEGSDINDFFTSYISPVLKEMGKETNPSVLLSNIENIQSSKRPVSDDQIKYTYNSSDLKKITSETASEFLRYLEDIDAYVNNFKGGSYSNYPAKDLNNTLSYLRSVESPNAGDIQYEIYSNHIKKGKNKIPVAVEITGLKDEEGEDMG